MRWLAALAGLVTGLAAEAQEYPALYDVRGVAADDVLNLRAGPGVSHPVLGSLRPDAQEVEVIGPSANGRWLQINLGEQTAWASSFYMQRRGPIWSFGLPSPLACFGTEPFWSLDRDGGTVTLTDMGFTERRYQEVWSGPATGGGDQAFGAVWQSSETRLSATLRREACNDGMSDRAFGMSILLIDETAEGAQMLSGCCSLAP